MSEAADSSRERHWWRWVSVITLVGSCIRVAFVWFAARGDGPVGDQLFYSAQAIANARGDWFEQPFASGVPAADHPPLTALVLTPVTWLFEWTGSVVTVQRLFMVLIGSASIPVMARLVRLLGGPRAGLVAATATAIYVNIWINDGLIMAETLTFLVVACLTIAVIRESTDHRMANCAAIGFLCALAALARPELLLLVPMTALFLVVHLRRRLVPARVASGVGTMVLVSLLVLAPWVIWNQIRFDGPVLMSTNDGLTLAGGNCDTTYYDDVGGWDIWCAYETRIPEGFDAAQASAEMRADGLEYWRDHLDRYPVVAAARLARVFTVGLIGAAARAATAEGRPVWLSHLGAMQYWAMLPFAVVGWRRRVTRLQRVVLIGTVPIVIVVALAANAYVRFRVPAEVGLVALAALGIDSMLCSAGRVLSARRSVSM